MEILSFELCGKFAHFRKFYSNSTAMSFSLPPRTTITGMLAGMMGRRRDSYYREFSRARLDIAIGIASTLRKSFHRLNLLKIEGGGDFRGAGGRVQTPFEVVSARDFAREELRYRIFLRAGPEGEETFAELVQALLHKRRRYTLSLGPANFHGWTAREKLWSEDMIRECTSGKAAVDFHTAVPADRVIDIEYDIGRVGRNFMVEEDNLPAEFAEDGSRKVAAFQRLLYSSGGDPLRVCIPGAYYRLDNGKDLFNIVFPD